MPHSRQPRLSDLLSDGKGKTEIEANGHWLFVHRFVYQSNNDPVQRGMGCWLPMWIAT